MLRKGNCNSATPFPIESQRLMSSKDDAWPEPSNGPSHGLSTACLIPGLEARYLLNFSAR